MSAPSGYAEVATQWSPYIAKTIMGSGVVPKEDVDDVIQDILVDLVAKDALSYFDETIAPWPAFLRNFTVRRCFRHAKYQRRWNYAKAILDQPVSEDGDETIGSAFAGAEEYVIAEWMLSRSELARFQDQLDVHFGGDPTKDDDLPFELEVFNLLVQQVLASRSEINPRAIADVLGVKVHAVNYALRRVRRFAVKVGFLA